MFRSRCEHPYLIAPPVGPRAAHDFFQHGVGRARKPFYDLRSQERQPHDPTHLRHVNAFNLDNLGNIALLGLAAKVGLIPSDLAEQVANAYRLLRRRQHALRMEGAEKARVPPHQLQQEREAVLQLWDYVMGDRTNVP